MNYHINMNRRSATLLPLLAVGFMAVLSSTASALTYVGEVAADNPLVYLRLEETSGTNAVNAGSSGATHDATYLGGFVQGNVGAITGDPSNNAVSLDGSSGRVLLNNAVAASTFSDNSYSVELWFNQDTASQARDLVSGVGPGHGILLETVSGGDNIRFLHRSPSGTSGGQNINPSSQTYDSPNWHHLVAVVDGGVMELYLDGIAHSGTGPSVSNAINFDIDFVLGRLTPTNSLRSFNGLLDEFAVYDQALSQARVLAHFNAASTTPIPEPTSAGLGLLSLAALARRRRRNA